MKKRIVTLAVALSMILCLTLVGCGQRRDSADSSNNHVTSQVEENTVADSAVTTEVATTAEAAEVEAETGTLAEVETNPSNGNFGMYTYELHGGITISCKTNVWDYIDGNTFNFRDMAHDLGFERDGNDYSSCSRFYHDLDDGSEITVSLLDARNSNEIYPYVVVNWYKSSSEYVDYFVVYDKTDTKYQVNSNPKAVPKGPHFSIDAIYIIAYAMEQWPTNYPNDIFGDIFGDYCKADGDHVIEYELP